MRFLSRTLFLLAGLSLLLASAPSTASASETEMTIARVFTGWRNAASFKRISEYFTGHENTGGKIILRTHPQQRSGFYFFLRTANPGSATAVKFNVELIAPDSPTPKNYQFTAELKPGDNIINLGLTGSDWPDSETHPVAWKIELAASDDRVLAVTKSYLWEKPAAK